MSLFPGYVIDTSALIDLWHDYALDVFPTLWNNSMRTIINNVRLIAPLEVLNELERKDDALRDWARRHRRMFRNLDNQQLVGVQSILSACPNFVDTLKTTPEADPFVVALARNYNWTVITSERPAANPHIKPKIPDVCTRFSVNCITSLVDFFRQENWQF